MRGADHLSHRLSLAQFTLKLLFVFFFTGSDHKKVADMSYSSYIVICVLNGVLGCIAVVFNCLTIHAIRKISSLSAGFQRALPDSSALPITVKILLISMAVSDLGVGLLVQPLTIAVYVLDIKGESTLTVLHESINTVICLIPGSFFTCASFFSVTALTIDRFLALYLHLRYKELVTRKRIVSVVIFIWILSAVLSLVYRLRLIETADGFFIAMEVLCLVVNAAIYCKIYEVVRRHTKHLKTLQVQQETQRSDIANVAKIVRSTISIFYVFVVFSICYIPCVTIHVASAAIRTESSHGQGTWIEQVHPYTGILLFLNSSLNPIIYCWKMRRIRFAIKSLILRPSVKENGQRSQQEDYYLR